MENKMIEEFQKINKRRQDDGMCITPLVMFAEAWDLKQADIDELRKRINSIKEIMSGDVYHIPTLIKDLNNALKGELE